MGIAGILVRYLCPSQLPCRSCPDAVAIVRPWRDRRAHNAVQSRHICCWVQSKVEVAVGVFAGPALGSSEAHHDATPATYVLVGTHWLHEGRAQSPKPFCARRPSGPRSWTRTTNTCGGLCRRCGWGRFAGGHRPPRGSASCASRSGQGASCGSAEGRFLRTEGAQKSWERLLRARSSAILRL